MEGGIVIGGGAPDVGVMAISIVILAEGHYPACRLDGSIVNFHIPKVKVNVSSMVEPVFNAHCTAHTADGAEH